MTKVAELRLTDEERSLLRDEFGVAGAESYEYLLRTNPSQEALRTVKDVLSKLRAARHQARTAQE